MIQDVIMPKIGLDMDEGTIHAWCKQVGDHVEVGETICRIETDKVVTDVESALSGTLVEILLDVEQTVPIATPIARIKVAE